MRSITMTTEQTAAYDADDMDLIREIRAEAQAMADATGETVEIYTADGIVADVRRPAAA